MNEVFTAVPGAHETVAAAHHAAGAAHHAAGSAHSEAHLGAAAAALGPIGAHFLAHYAPAQANCLAATMLVGNVYQALGAGTQAHKAVTVACDNA